MNKDNKKTDYVEGAIKPPKIETKEEIEKKKRENEELRKVFKGEKK